MESLPIQPQNTDGANVESESARKSRLLVLFIIFFSVLTCAAVLHLIVGLKSEKVDELNDTVGYQQ